MRTATRCNAALSRSWLSLRARYRDFATMHAPLVQNDTPQLRLSELLGALSHALDMVEGQPAGHCVRCCWA